MGENHSSGEWEPPPSPPPAMVMAGMPSDMGTFESVLEIPSSRNSTPMVANARAATCTSGLLVGVRPTGRSPIRLNSTVISPSFQRAFSSATASNAAALARASSCLSSSISFERMSRAKLALAAIELTDVPPVTVPTVKVVFGNWGVSNSAIFVIARAMAWIALARPKAPKEWPPGPLK